MSTSTLSYFAADIAAQIDAAEQKASLAVKQSFAELRARLLKDTPPIPGLASQPTWDECRDPSNKINGVNLSDEGVERVYRLYDHGASVRKVSRLLDISHGAAKWRQNKYQSENLLSRPRKRLSTDAVSA